MGAVSGDFERRLAEQESPAVIVPHIESEARRGRDYVRITVSVEVSAPDVTPALTAPWSVFRQAASDDTAGWDLSSATAEVWPEGPLTAKPGVRKPSRLYDGALAAAESRAGLPLTAVCGRPPDLPRE